MAQMPADFSDWLDFVAIGALLSFVWDAPSHAYALLAVGMGLPYIVIGPVAGVFVDRWSIRAVLIWSNLGRALVTATFYLAGNWPLLIALIALRSCVDSFFTPAKQAAIQSLTDQDERASANGLSHGINQASKIVAPGLGGAALIWVAPNAIFLLNAMISASAALLAMRLRPINRPDAETGDDQSGILAGIGTGLDVVRENRLVQTTILMMTLGYFAMFIYDTFIAPLTQSLGFEPQHLGYALAAVGIGGVCGSIYFSFLPDLEQPQSWIAAGTSCSAIMLLVLSIFDLTGLPMPLLIFAFIFLVLGVATSMSVLPFRVVLQNNVPQNRMGSVTALSEAAVTAALLTAPFIGAVLARAYSIGTPFFVGGLVMFAVAIIAVCARWE